MTATITDLSYHRALRDVQEATKALIAITKRTREETRRLKASTDERRRKLDAKVAGLLPCDVEWPEGA